MSDSDRPDAKSKKAHEHRGSGMGRSGTASSIGAELGGDLDFEPDALLDSLLADDLGEAPAPASLPGPKLHEPSERVFSPEDITAVGSHDSLIKMAQAELAEAEDDEVDTLLHDTRDATGQAPAPRRPQPPRPPPRAAPPRPSRVTREPPETAASPTSPEAGAEHSPRPAPSIPDSQLLSATDDDIVLGADDEIADDIAFGEDVLESLPAPERTSAVHSEPPESLTAADYDELTPSHTPEPSQLSASPSFAPHTRTLPPLPRPSGAPGSWEDERPAAAQITENGTLDQWIARAKLVEEQAQSLTDLQARARALIVASELWAIAGDTTRARQIAGEAAQVAPAMPLAGRQLRWLAAEDGDWGAVATALETETRASPTPEARAHSAYLSAEIHRLLLDDADGAQHKLEQAARALPADPRAHVMKLVGQLGKNPNPAAIRWPEAPALEPLVAACHEVALFRGLDEESPPRVSTVVSFEKARKALQGGDRAAAGHRMLELGGVEGLDQAASWLAAALFAPSAETRPLAIRVLSNLLARERTPLVERALAARALEQGDSAALGSAIGPTAEVSEQEPSATAFTPADRIALAALIGAARETTERHIDELARDEALLPLAAAALSSVTPPTETPRLAGGSQRSQSEVAIGRLLTLPDSDSDALRLAADSFGSLHPDHPLSRFLPLELAVLDGNGPAIAQQLAQWPRAEGSDGEQDCDRHLAAALVYEIAGTRDAAAEEYGAALTAEPSNVAAARALAAHSPPVAAAELFVALSQAVSDEAQRSLFLVEAALRRGTDDPEEYDSLLSQAAHAMPTLPFAYQLAEHLARSRGDADQLLAWLRARRESMLDPIERAHDLVREALLVADSDMELAAHHLEEATNARPGDIGLAELHDRLAPGPRAEKGAWRERAASTAVGDAKLRFLLEATLEYERAGDAEAAARAALEAAETSGSEFARATVERVACMGPQAGRLAEELLGRARNEQDPIAQRELYERLSKIDAARGDHSSALLWQSAVLERTPNYLPALRRLEHEYIGAGRDEELDPIAAALTPLLERNEATAHAMLASRLRTRSGDWRSARELVETAARHQSPSLWALREQATHALAAGDDDALFEAERKLCDLSTRAIDAATLALRAAEAAARLSRLDDARALLERAVEMVPEHLVALTTQVEVLEACGNFTGAAQSLEVLADASAVDAHRLGAWYHAALLWLDKVGDQERAVTALEQAAEIDPKSEDVFNRLQALYVERGERAKLAKVLERRLAQTTDPEERVALEVTRGRALAEVGEREAAKQALASALDESPEHTGALAAFAELCASEKDWPNAEQAWIRLARHLAEPERQADVYRKLGTLYDTELPNPERAELAYREVLKRVPQDVEAVERLIRVYARLGNPSRSVELATELVNNAKTLEEKRDRTLALADVFEQVVGDHRKAEATLDRARKAWGHDGKVLRALAEFYRRNGEDRAEHVLLDRAAADARRALGTGRFETSFFEVLGTVAELRGDADAAQVAQAALLALEGNEQPVRAAGPAGADVRFDDLLAPDMLGLPLRSLLKKTGDAFDAAYPLDLRALRATPLPAEAATFGQHVQQVAQAFGITNLDVFVSQSVGGACVPVSTSPPQLLFGQDLLDSTDEAARYFLMVRTLKILQGRAATLSRTAPIELWPLTAAYLSIFAPNWHPQGVDFKRMTEARQRLQAAMPRRLDTDVPVLALEVIGSIGNRASQLGTAINEWGNRTALLATGNPAAALRAIAFASGQTIPEDRAERLKWVVRHAEARDLMVFSVSEQHAEARRQLRLS